MKIKVAINLGDLSEKSSTKNYMRNLVNSLEESDVVEPVVVYTSGDPKNYFQSITPTFEIADRIIPQWHKVTKEYEIDLLHTDGIPLLSHYCALSTTVPTISTMHGTRHKYWVKNVPKKHIRYFDGIGQTPEPHIRRRIYKNSEKFGKYTHNYIFTVSDWIRDGFVSKAKYPPEKVITTYEAIDSVFFETPQQNSPTDLPDKYIFHVSYPGPRKNLLTAIEAYNNLVEQVPSPPVFVIAGPGWKEVLIDKIRKLELIDHIKFVGYKDSYELIPFYDNALCFVFPSFVEGFGLPLIEAMARGTPVITTSRCAIPEVVGSAALLLDDPENDAELSRIIRRVITKEKIAGEYKTRGQDRAKRYTWNRHIDTVEREYKKIIRSHNE